MESYLETYHSMKDGGPFHPPSCHAPLATAAAAVTIPKEYRTHSVDPKDPSGTMRQLHHGGTQKYLLREDRSLQLTVAEAATTEDNFG